MRHRASSSLVSAPIAGTIVLAFENLYFPMARNERLTGA